MLLYKKHIANITFLSGIFLASGDVNASGVLTAADVLLIKKRIAFVTNSFVVGDWLFNNNPVEINGANVTQNFNGLCFGDANGSYIPSSKGSSVAELVKNVSGSLTIRSADAQSGKITLPVFASDLENLGSFQFTIVYDASKLTFTGADHWYSGIENVVVGNPQPGKLTFVWAADANGISIADEKLCELHFTSYSSEASVIAWSDFPTTREFASYDGSFFIPVYTNGALGPIAGIGIPNDHRLLIYPNPALDFVTIRSGDVIKSVKLFNNLGKVVFDKNLNTSEITLATESFGPGLYLIQVDTQTDRISRTILIEK
ncbi:MAG: T9SS type A sorting domain-containing protein [Bacteroidales bacterium]|nr:T9SS type A sorting domain-containing protein [Bacteroidales bacterium]